DSAAVAHLSAVPFYNSKLRTTCVATMMDAGHAENALPQSARVTVNCRILPGQPASEVEATLRRLAADDRVTLRETNTPIPSPPSPLTAAIMGPIEQLAAEQFPSVRVPGGAEPAGAPDERLAGDAGSNGRPMPLAASILWKPIDAAAEQGAGLLPVFIAQRALAAVCEHCGAVRETSFGLLAGRLLRT